MRLLYSLPFIASTLTFFIPNGNWGGFLLVYRGTNNSTPKTRANVGNVNLTWNGTPLINVDYELLSYLSDLKGGVSTFTSTASSTFKTAVFIPCGAYGDSNNSYFINDSQKVYFKLDFASLADITGQVYIYGIPKAGVNNYHYCLTSRNVTSSGVGTIADVHRLNNVSALYLKGHSIVDNTQILQDGNTVFDGMTTDLQMLSDFTNRVETSNSLIELDLNRSKDVREIISSEINFKYSFNTSGILEQYFAYTVLTPTLASLSTANFQKDVKVKIQKTGIAVQDGIKPITSLNSVKLINAVD